MALWEASDFDFNIDKSVFNRYNDMVFVSGETMRKFTAAHPEYKEMSIYMPNLLSAEYVQERGKEKVAEIFPDSGDKLKLITVAGINFAHKGYDRGIEIMRRLKEDGLIEKIRWIIIGDGRDSDRLLKLISLNDLGRYIKCLGRKTNPIPYLKECDILFLLFRFEVKPTAVPEAQIMGVLPLVSRCVSANEQINCGEDGIVTDNNTDALYESLKNIILNPSQPGKLKEKIRSCDYGNTDKISVWDFFETIKELYEDKTISQSKRDSLYKVMQRFTIRRSRHYIINGQKKKAAKVLKPLGKTDLKKDLLITKILLLQADAKAFNKSLVKGSSHLQPRNDKYYLQGG